MDHDTDRKNEALDAALPLFLRFGYRKTSMDQVARAVGLSRQGLYLWFPGKEALFKAVMLRAVAQMRERIRTALTAEDWSVDQRVIAGFQAYIGPFVGGSAEELNELFDAAKRLVGPQADELEAELLAQLTAVLPERDWISREQLAQLLITLATGLKHRSSDRALFDQRLNAFVPALLSR